MTILTLDLPEGIEPCPQGCGRTTEDPYGGPCKACWDALDSHPSEDRT